MDRQDKATNTELVASEPRTFHPKANDGRASLGVRLHGDWDEIVALEGSKSPWEALRATKTSPLTFATFEKANTCAKQFFS